MLLIFSKKIIGRKTCFILEHYHPEFLHQEEVQSAGTKGLSDDYFRVTGVIDSVFDFADFFLRNGTNFFLLSEEEFLLDDIFDSLYTLRMRESEKWKTEMKLYNLEIQKKSKPDYHQLKITVTKKCGAESEDEEFCGQKRKNSINDSLTLCTQHQDKWQKWRKDVHRHNQTVFSPPWIPL